MNRIEKSKIKTDQVRNRLYSCLETDGLLPTEGCSSAIRPVVWINIISIAVIIFLCIYLPITLRADSQSSTSGSLVKVNKEGNILVTTPEDGFVVYLSRQTSLQHPKHFSEKKRGVSLKGNALFSVAGDRARPLLIETEKVRIEVVDIAFHIKNGSNSPSELPVQQDEVRVAQGQDGQETHIRAGETATSLQNKWYLTTTRDSKQFARYTRRMCFKDERLDNIPHVINLRQSEIHLESSPELDGHLLTVSSSDDSPEKVAELISIALNLKCTRKHNVITFVKQFRNPKKKKR